MLEHHKSTNGDEESKEVKLTTEEIVSFVFVE